MEFCEVFGESWELGLYMLGFWELGDFRFESLGLWVGPFFPRLELGSRKLGSNSDAHGLNLQLFVGREGLIIKISGSGGSIF